jgi:hypothetical protein
MLFIDGASSKGVVSAVLNSHAGRRGTSALIGFRSSWSVSKSPTTLPRVRPFPLMDEFCRRWLMLPLLRDLRSFPGDGGRSGSGGRSKAFDTS